MSRLHERAILPVVLLRDGVPDDRPLLRLARRREVEILLDAGRHKAVRHFPEENIADVAPMPRRREADRTVYFRMRIIQPRPCLDPAMFMAMNESSVFRAGEQKVVQALAKEKGIACTKGKNDSWKKTKEKQFDYLAEQLRQHLNMDKIYHILGYDIRGERPNGNF